MSVKFGELSSYSGGFVLPEGDYALVFDVRMHAHTKGDGTKGQERLGVMAFATPIDRSTGKAVGETQEQFYSLGTKASLSFAPDPDTGKGLVAIPGAQAGSLAGNTNFNLFLKGLYDSGLPEGIFVDSVEPIDGIWLHLQPQPEPEGRKAFGAKTGEAALLGQQQQSNTPQMIAIPTEIIEGGRPWVEGEGGVPEFEEAKPAKKVAAKPAAKPAMGAKAAPAKTVAKPAAKAAPAAAPAADSGVEDVAASTITSILEVNPSGISKLKLQMETFKAIKGAVDDETAQAVTNTYFKNPEALAALLAPLGFGVDGANVAPV